MTETMMYRCGESERAPLVFSKIFSGEIPGFDECCQFLEEIPKFAKRHSVRENREFLEYLGSPDIGMKIIHVAGTNGKGSVCDHLSNILMEAGYSVGMFTSPHLERITERFRTGGKIIDDEVFCSIFSDLILRIRDYPDRNYFPAYFSFLFFMAMLLYERYPVDFLVLETGRGGSDDVTNSIHEPLLDVITEIGMDHMEVLGNTISRIAEKKAGILRKNVPVVYMNRREESTQVIKKRAEELGCRGYNVEPLYVFDIKPYSDPKGLRFSYRSPYDEFEDLTIRTPAKYQTENAAIAIMCARALIDMGVMISQEDVRAGLNKSEWQGRMECIYPGIYVDGAHNADGMTAFLESVRLIPCKGRRYLLFGVSSDKQYDLMIRKILKAQVFDGIFITAFDSERGASAIKLKEAIRSESVKQEGLLYLKIHCCLGVKEALNDVLKERCSEDIVFAAGSLYLVGEVRRVVFELAEEYIIQKHFGDNIS